MSEVTVKIGRMIVISVLTYFTIMLLTIIAIMSKYPSCTRQQINNLIHYFIWFWKQPWTSIFFLLYRWGNQGSEKLCYFSKVTGLVSTGSGLTSKFLSFFFLDNEKADCKLHISDFWFSIFVKLVVINERILPNLIQNSISITTNRRLRFLWFVSIAQPFLDMPLLIAAIDVKWGQDAIYCLFLHRIGLAEPTKLKQLDDPKSLYIFFLQCE